MELQFEYPGAGGSGTSDVGEGHTMRQEDGHNQSLLHRGRRMWSTSNDPGVPDGSGTSMLSKTSMSHFSPASALEWPGLVRNPGAWYKAVKGSPAISKAQRFPKAEGILLPQGTGFGVTWTWVSALVKVLCQPRLILDIDICYLVEKVACSPHAR